MSGPMVPMGMYRLHLAAAYVFGALAGATLIILVWAMSS